MSVKVTVTMSPYAREYVDGLAESLEDSRSAVIESMIYFIAGEHEKAFIETVTLGAGVEDQDEDEDEF